METVKNFKMYKSGKAWVYSSILVASVGLGGSAVSNYARADIVTAASIISKYLSKKSSLKNTYTTK